MTAARASGALPRLRRTARRPSAGPSVGRRLVRRAVAALVLAGALAAGYGLWLRDSSLVRVEHVEVRGIGGPDAPEIRAAIVEAARRMTTLNVRTADLERAVAGNPAVRAVEVDPRLPHGLEVRIVPHRPVARLRAAGAEGPPVGADGTLLTGLRVERPLPVLESPQGRGEARGTLRDRRAMRSVRVLAAAPPVLDGRIAGTEEGRERGMVVQLRRGPELVFGDLSRLAFKWSAAIRVLADPASRGASYVDVRLPDRPAAGGLGEAEAPADSAAAGGSGSGEAAPGAAGASHAEPSTGGASGAATAPETGVEDTP